MIINDTDNDRLMLFMEDALDFLRSKTANKYYAENPSARSIELLDGSVVPASEEGVFVLDNEFEAYIVGNLVKYIEMMIENINNSMFGLGERTLYEYITGWLFLAVSGHVHEKDVNRMKALLFAGFYKHVAEDRGGLKRYMEGRSSALLPKDMERLDSLNFTEFNDYIWKVLNGIVGQYPFVRKGTIDRLGGGIMYKHQSMTLHANPTAIGELVSTMDKTVRHRLIVAFNLRQAIEYYRGTGRLEANRLIYSFDKFWKNHKIRES